MNYLKRSLMLFACLYVCFSFSNASEVLNLDGINQEMCNSNFWISRILNADEVLLTNEEIEKLNRDIINTKGNYVVDLREVSQKFDGKTKAKLLAEFETPKGYYIDDKPVDSIFFDNIKNNIKGAKVSKNMSVKYAIAVNRSVMKSYPYDELMTDDINDLEWDQFALTSVAVNEPLIVYFATKDNKFFYVRSELCDGWIKSEDIAICKNREEWLEAQSMEKFLIVTGEKIYLEANYVTPELSEKMLDMGTKLEIVDSEEVTSLIDDRYPWNNYIVKMPMRDKNGGYFTKYATIPFNRDVNVGYLPYTPENIITMAFKHLGNRYGWGGMLNSLDCSEYVRKVYCCCGIFLPRNTTWQALTPVRVGDLANASIDEKNEALDFLRPGTILQFTGHEMIYLGKVDEEYYVINSVGSVMANDEKLRIRTVVVNPLSIKRANGSKWIEAFNRIIDVSSGSLMEEKVDLMWLNI